MKILITGITGLLGSYLAKYFSPTATIYGIKRAKSNLSLLGDLADNIQWYEGDLNDFELMEEACTGKDLVIHAAGMVSFEPNRKEALLKANTYGTANLVNAMLCSGSKKLVFISSVAALGREEGTDTINEEHKWSNSEFNSPYAISKHLAELEVWRGAQEGLEVMVFNPSVLLGKIADGRSSSQIYQYVLKGSAYYPTGNINYVDIRDAVAIMGKLIASGKWNERYIINKESIPYKEFFQEMAKIFGKKVPEKPLGSGLGTLVVAWAWVNNLFSKQKIPLTNQTLQLSKMIIRFDSSKIKALINHQFTPLKETFAWAKG